MPRPRKDIAHELIVRVRTDYAAGKAVRKIMAETGLSSGTLYKIIDGDCDIDLPGAIKRRYGMIGGIGRRAALVARLWNTAERQVREIETRLRRGKQEATERERDARVLAVLVRTLRDLNAFDESTKVAAATTADENDDMPADIDEFRNELARRIRAFVGERESGGIPRAADGANE